MLFYWPNIYSMAGKKAINGYWHIYCIMTVIEITYQLGDGLEPMKGGDLITGLFLSRSNGESYKRMEEDSSMFNNSFETLRSLYSSDKMMNMWNIWLDNYNWSREKFEDYSRQVMENSKSAWEESTKLAEMFYGQIVKTQDSIQSMSREMVSASMENISKTLATAKKSNAAA